MKAVVVLNNVGDYHAARLNSSAVALRERDIELVAIEASVKSSFYAHKQRGARRARRLFGHVLLAAEGETWTVRRLWKTLAQVRPDWIFTIGYSDKLSLATLAYATRHRTPVFFMADSKADDQPRKFLGERLKSLIIRCFSGALVAGERHRDYFRSLGMKAPIELGYDVIDNEFFQNQAARLTRKLSLVRGKGILPERYVLCVSRLVERKRLDVVLRLYAQSVAIDQSVRLVVIGAGSGDAQLHELAKELGVSGMLCHHRNVRNSMMPLFYAHADAVILASDYDQWGLCVNEAMAVGVPCIVTRRCGVAGEIVQDGYTGFVIEPDDYARGAAMLDLLITDTVCRNEISEAATVMMRKWNLDRFTSSMIKICGASPNQIKISSHFNDV